MREPAIDSGPERGADQPGAAPAWVAIHLDGLGAQAMSSKSAAPWIGSLPPAALAPRFDDEPVRADVQMPPHVRASGHPWPLEALVTAERGAARLPVAYAWQLLRVDGTWSFADDTGPRTLDPADALVAVIGAAVLVQTGGDTRARPRILLVIPNDLPERAQQALIDRCEQQGLDVKLLWRPIAGALTWFQRFGTEMAGLARGGPRGTERVLGRIIALHLGIDGCEAASIAVVARPRDLGGFQVLRCAPIGVLPSFRCSSGGTGSTTDPAEPHLSDAGAMP